MAKPNLPNEGAEDVVFENLGLSREELGVTDADEGSGWEDSGDDQGSGNEEQQSRVSHTSRKESDDTPRFPKAAEVKPDGKGNLLGPDGQVVARAGKEARLYQDLHKTRGQAQTLQGQVNDVTQRLHKAVEIGQQLHRDLQAERAKNTDAVKQFGLDQGEHLTALRLFKELKDNPQGTLKNLLTRAAANGISVEGQAGGIDPKAIVDLIRQEIGTAVNPLKERTAAEQRAEQQRQEENRQRAQVQSEVDGFFSSNPDAREYLPVFQQTLQKFPSMTLGEVWARIQLHFAQNPQQRRTNSQKTRSLPAGRQAPTNGFDDMASVHDSYDTIIKDVMSKAGYR